MIFINILVLNSGSSSLKFQLINMQNEQVLAKGVCEKIGALKSIIRHKNLNGEEINSEVSGIDNHEKAFEHIEKMLLDEKTGAIENISQIHAVGHRVVHGGTYFKSPAIIDSKVIKKIENLAPLAPLHNPAHVLGIKACQEMLGKSVPQVAVFDTSFYFDLPQKAYMFAIPYKYYEKYGIRKYGFHGTSHEFVMKRYLKIIGTTKNQNDLKIISCHLGNGSSITAIKNNKAVETSMGLTPMGGIMMGTRSGSLDPSVLLHIAKNESLTIDEINNILNKQSGLLGVSQICNDYRTILQAESEGNEKAKLAHEMMIYQITQYIGAYTAILKGCDAIIFTGGIGENQWVLRERICENLGFMGLKFDKKINKETALGKEAKISTKDSKVDVFVVPTNEELSIARSTFELLKNNT